MVSMMSIVCCNMDFRAIAGPMRPRMASNNCRNDSIRNQSEALMHTQILPLNADPVTLLIPADTDKDTRSRLGTFAD